MSANDTITGLIASENNIPLRGVRGVIALLDDGATIPFISRYRKEATGGLDEEQVAQIKQQYGRLTELVKRRETILATIEEQGRLTDDLRAKIEACYDPVQLEDIYLPYKPKRRTKATVARERGLEPLAALIMRQDGAEPQAMAARFVKGEVESAAMALEGACDIIAEWVSESERSRSAMRTLFGREAVISSKVVKGKEQEGAKFSDYFDSGELLSRTPSHRLMAQLRGEREGFLRIGVAPDEDKALERLDRIFVRGNSPAVDYVEDAVKDSYKRLLRPSMETETLGAARERADNEAIAVFATNLRQLLLAAPLGRKRVLAIDPGFRSGCKVVCLDEQGGLMHNENIYPHPPQNETARARERLTRMVAEYGIEAVAVGDGTAGRETETLVRSLGLPDEVEIFMVSEDGASVYSASPVARAEFPDHDVTVRGAVSIGRRLIDPLAELVKIDPKAIGVGQYQHDVDQTKLKNSLDAVVESCVNRVGVNVNTASQQLLAYVSGLGESLARNIVEYRAANGPFTGRAQLNKVPRLGPKAFEQCAGFLRIPDARNPLDNSAVHPESYCVVEAMARDLGVSVAEMLRDPALRKNIDISKYVTEKTGLPTLTDIMAELDKPGRDPRGRIEAFSFAEGVHSVDDLREGMVLPGIVTNITNFGAFVDIGVKQDGLVHISQLADKYVANPNDVVRLQQKVQVKVTDIDRARGRISLSMKGIE
ncbi:RNA-binding transcriptional accessory protein [Alistipes sp. OttesenSCG-928-B03]|nr:RNA-binding transcriptional accessory protein [Alistipes sp. OttesenSCG-928-B03]